MTQIFLEDEPWHSCVARGCPATFSRFSGLQKHLTEAHPKKEKLSYPCVLKKGCSLSFSTPWDWLQHVALKHPNFVKKQELQSSRIDRIYVPKEVKVCNSETFCLPYSDHNPVYVHFVDLRHHYQMWSSLKPGFDPLSDWWENIKGRIRELAIKHSKRRVRKKRERLNHLQAHCSASTAEEIDNLIGTEAEGAYIRSRAKFLEFGERPSSYFFRLESRRGSQKIVRSIRGPNGDIFNRKDDIIRVFHDFYSSLYSKERNVDHGLQDSFIHSVNSTIDNNQKNKLDLPISSDEIYSALRRTPKNKTPGIDGLPYEFYLDFYDLIGSDLLAVLMTFLLGALYLRLNKL
ncbi:hypothetical protein HOLleu_17323 [Holothuria leucospilota]|uniref:C2H2-type domain-containing protein n=1 Tax=Holothuria leucospilota TaxID=206669 RepID=A0A9Q1C7I6_HOLLE|nr:hypothetical protein HOLleu_17323 [Holothuria leucospilota]